LGVPVELLGGWDTEEGYTRSLRPVLERLHPGTGERLHLGPSAGDILACRLEDLPDVDAVVSGPPCPPWSSLGIRRGSGDPRAAVFDRVVEMILHWAGRGCLSFFVLENVPGIRRVPSGAGECYLERVLRGLRTGLSRAPESGARDSEAGRSGGVPPAGLGPGGRQWTLRVLDINAAQCTLPHDRERVFIVGVTAELAGGPWGLKWPAVSGRKNAQRPLGEFLAAERRLPRASLTTPKIRDNAAHYSALQRSAFPGQILVGDLSRAAGKVFGARYKVGACPTLCTGDNYLMVFEDDGPESADGRYLTVESRAGLCGVVFESLEGLTRADQVRALGNAIPVPLIGTVLQPVVRAWAEAATA
jgi:site-specific DNA-cytosine methylase